MTNKIILFITIFIFPIMSLSQDFEVSPVIINFDAEPGETQTKSINVINHADQKSVFNIMLGDFIVNKEGKVIDMPSGSSEHSLANWISINPPLVELEPNESKQVIVSLQAPTGDYSTRWANIYIRSTKEQTALTADKKLQTGLILQGQIVVRIYQSPKSNVNYRMKITGIKEITTGQDTARRFKAIMDNLGDKITDCKVILLASNLVTAEETVLQKLNFKMFPGQQREIELQMPKDALPPGKYALAAILDYGKQSNLEGTQMIITVD